MTNLTVGNMNYQLKYNFSSLLYLEQEGIDIAGLGTDIKMKDIVIILKAGLGNVSLEETENIINELVEQEGLNKALEIVSNKISEAFVVKK